MMRQCVQCQREFTPADLVKEESKNMAADRKALGLEGVRFLYYACPGCGRDAIFLDVLRLDREAEADFERRRGELEEAVGQVHAGQVRVVFQRRQ